MNNSAIIEVNFPLCFYKKLLGLKLGFSDFEILKPEVARNLKAMGRSKADLELMDLSFVVTIGNRNYPLVPNGENILVTEENYKGKRRLICRICRDLFGLLCEQSG